MNGIVDEAFTGLDDLCGASDKRPSAESGEMILYVCTKKPHSETEMHYDKANEFAWWKPV